MLLCPSISVNLFEEEKNLKCCCKKINCNCLENTIQVAGKKPSLEQERKHTLQHTKNKTGKKQLIETVPLDRKYNPLRRVNNKYYPPNVCVTIEQTCTDKSLSQLFANGVRLVHIQLALGTRERVERLILKVCTAIAAHYLKYPNALPIALALEIGGRVLRTGRMHNDESAQLIEGNRVFVTSIIDYKYCSNKDIIYVSNLERYFTRLQVGEFIFINKSKIQLAIVKVTHTQNTLTCCILRGSHLDSNMEVILPYLIDQDASLTEDELFDCYFAVNNKADLIVVPIVSNMEYLVSVRKVCNQYLNRKVCKPSRRTNVFLLSEIEPSSFENDRCSANAIVEASDGLWWTKSTARISENENNAICRAKQMCKPIVIAFGALRTVSGCVY